MLRHTLAKTSSADQRESSCAGSCLRRSHRLTGRSRGRCAASSLCGHCLGAP